MQEWVFKLNFYFLYTRWNLLCVFVLLFPNLPGWVRALFIVICWCWLVFGKKTRWLWSVTSSFPKFKYTESPPSQVGRCVTWTWFHMSLLVAQAPSRARLHAEQERTVDEGEALASCKPFGRQLRHWVKVLSTPHDSTWEVARGAASVFCDGAQEGQTIWSFLRKWLFGWSQTLGLGKEIGCFRT